ncbi:MAG: EAL domain-containing protein [Clostridia bacterium]|nr:EAL domain-containing protein [Clostridia bacterium]MDY5554217.1 EAL domain-containing protein [Blautia sp.]
MNIQFQICGLCILFLLIIFYKSHKTLHLYKEKIFYSVLCILTVSLIEDILSLVVIHYRYSLTQFLVYFVCKVYIVSLIWGAWSALIYILTDVVSEKKHRKLTLYLMLLATGQSIIVFFLPIHIFENENQVYTFGSAVMAVYIFVALYIISTLTITYAFRRILNPRKRFAIILWMLIWMISALIQFCNNAILIVGFASAIGALILFVLMENPEANLERKLGCFNSYALTEYLHQMFERKINFNVLEVSFENKGLQEETGMNVYEIMREILQISSQYDDIFAFKNISLSLVLVSEKTQNLKSAGETILNHFGNLNGFNKKSSLILASVTDEISDMEELFSCLSFIRKEYEDERGKLIITNKDMISKFREKYLVEQEISEALEEDRVEVFLQPIYSNHDLSFTSAEALVRIRKKDGELLSPGLFIPVAEENGQILDLGERVFEKVCCFLKNSDAIKLGIHYIEVNLSVIQCERADLAERLISIIERYQIHPGLINLEITETASIRSRKIMLQNMKKLINYGFSFSLDDFGKGESNLMYVVDMPVSIVKLDYDMSKAFFKSSKAVQIVKSVVNMVHSMGMKLVAEGIEEKEEIEGMLREGIDYIQGFYYSRPLPEEEFVRFLRNAGQEEV